ncbi:MAG: PIN domain-containing protein [Spirochaetaceae bacterium]|jgi:predicted nucleic acid-binding protein|nr:PIN domain-containing protein [Spirochaetaceae bacterium]
MINKIFVDTNIWIYLFLLDNEKYKIVEDFLLKNSFNSIFVISYQVINEVSNTLLRYKFSEIEIRRCVEHLYRTCTIQDFTKEIVLTASFLREKYSFSFWDSVLVGSALFSGSDILVSEDMQHGLVVEKKLVIKNIFLN